ncbi:MAG TPA: hypothetical protein VK994_01645 [Bacteroidales bacterium]|nr:hypothetical protein [Bacteroidales bacterium]
MKAKLIIFMLAIMLAGMACKKDNDTSQDNGVVTTVPKISSLSADKYEIKVGGEEPAIIECMATGGNLSYVWEVDLGDIFPLNESGSQVRFTGSECCLGDKLITCTVSNDKGEVSETVTIHIYIP